MICMYILYIYKPDTHFYIDRFAFALTFLLQVVPFLTYTFCSAQKTLLNLFILSKNALFFILRVNNTVYVIRV